MRVIKQGPAEFLNWPREVTVSCCKSILEIEPQDVKMHYDQRDGDWASILCPVCNTTVEIVVHHGKEAERYLRAKSRGDKRL